MRLILPAVPPRPTRAFEIYWQFAAERQQMYLRRMAGHPVGQLTDDPVLAAHRFTNAYRAADRVSQYLIASVQYNHRWNWLDTFVRTLVFKVFNRIDTWQYLLRSIGEPDHNMLSNHAIDHALGHIAGVRPLYSPAYVMPPPRSYRGPKYLRHLSLIRDMVTDHAHIKVQQSPTMAHAYEILLHYDSIGPFLAYQYVTDLNYSVYLNFSENEFTVPGPGALRGLSKCFHNGDELSSSYLLGWTQERQHEEFRSRGLSWHSLWGRDLRLIDVQNLFCEVDKYTRVVMPYLGTTNRRTRIKQRYHPNHAPLVPWFPPKWGINQYTRHNLLTVTELGQANIPGITSSIVC